MVPSMTVMRFLFRGKFINIWMVMCVALMVGRMFITRPTIYNSAVGAFTATPFISDNNTQWLFVQALVICASTAIAAGLYSVLVFIPVPKYIVVSANAIWQLSHGMFFSLTAKIVLQRDAEKSSYALYQNEVSNRILGLVLLFLNRDIREEVRELFKCEKKINRMFVLSSTTTNK
ncbi:hypothetical protein GCK32_000843 [Trichostrongylus colubriformis]|uniref:Uncharacterized protein n=1 Tax=Trichostrongylus colubriformis TaxID=6319 RepID=A0AAN8FP59_TRICO